MLDLSALTAIDPFSAMAVNRIASARWALAVEPDDGEDPAPPQIIFALAQEQRFEAGDVEIGLSGAFGEVTLMAKAGFVDALSDWILPAWREEQPGRLPLRWRAVLVATHLARLAAMEAAIADISGMVLARRRTHRPHGTSLSGSVEFGGRSWPLCLALDLHTQAPIATPALRRLPRRGWEPDFACAISTASRTLEFSDYRGLSTGDVVLVSGCGAVAVPLFGEIDGLGRLSFLAAPDGVLTVRSINNSGCGTMGSQGPQLPSDEAPLPHDEDIEDEEDLPEAGTPFLPQIDRAIDDLPVTLDFRLGTRRLTLADVRALAPGAVLDLEINLADTLTILANGSVIGRGHLVQVGDYIGVQITHWPPAKGDGHTKGDGGD